MSPVGRSWPATLSGGQRQRIALADEVIFLAEGVVAARGTHEDLLARVPACRDLVTAYERRAEEGSA